MAYDVEIMPRAYRDLVDIYLEINAEHAPRAQEWFNGLEQIIASLKKLPNRGTTSRKHAAVRNLFYGDNPHVYVIHYQVIEEAKRVEVLHIRHGARLGDF
jgi:plasmid stabilization system protein ParE